MLSRQSPTGRLHQNGSDRSRWTPANNSRGSSLQRTPDGRPDALVPGRDSGHPGRFMGRPNPTAQVDGHPGAVRVGGHLATPLRPTNQAVLDRSIQPAFDGAFAKLSAGIFRMFGPSPDSRQGNPSPTAMSQVVYTAFGEACLDAGGASISLQICIVLCCIAPC